MFLGVILKLSMIMAMARGVELNRTNFERFSPDIEGGWSIIEEDAEEIELIDFGGEATLLFGEREYDTYVNPHAAKEVREMLKAIFSREDLSSIGFSLEDKSESDLLNFLSLTEDESSLRKCPRCGKSFSTSSYTHYHLIRDHLVHKYLEQPEGNTYTLLDKTCSFIDCSRTKD